MTLGVTLRVAAVVAAIAACGLAIRSSSGPAGSAAPVAARGVPGSPGSVLPWPEGTMRAILARVRAVQLWSVLWQADAALQDGDYARARDFCREALRLGGDGEGTGRLIDLANELEHCVIGRYFARTVDEWDEAFAALTARSGRQGSGRSLVTGLDPSFEER